MHLYVTEQGTRLGKRGGHLVVSKDGETLDDVLFEEVESAVLFGSVYPTTDAMFALLDSGAEIAFLTRSGHFKGRLVASTGKNVSLRLKQYDAFRNSSRAFGIAKGYVCRKLENGYRVLDACHRNPHNPFRFDERGEYRKAIAAAKKCPGEDRDVLRGLEGYGAKIYFQGFARCLMNDLKFPGRVYYPSTDPVNALLSFGYSFVARTLESLLESYGIDPMLGFLHEPGYGRASLALDLLEEFRHPLVDRLILKIFNRGFISSEDFEQRNDEGKSGQLYLKPDAVRVFIRNYEEFCDAPNRIYKERLDLPWRSILRLRVEALRKALLEDGEIVPFEWDAGEDAE